MRIGERSCTLFSLSRVVICCVLGVGLLDSCSWFKRDGGYYQDDGPPKRSRVELSKVPDAVPRFEVPSKSGNRPYTALGKRYYPVSSTRGYRERGIASWYGKQFHGRRTANGDTYDMFAMSAAHRTLPLPSYVRVRNLSNGRAVVVRVNDRGPFLHNRLIDLSYVAARKLGIVATGTGMVEVVAVFPNSTIRPASNKREIRNSSASPVMYVQIGAFRSLANAQSLRVRLESAGFRPVSVQVSQSSGRRVHRVRIGPVASITEADRVVAEVSRSGIATPSLVIE